MREFGRQLTWLLVLSSVVIFARPLGAGAQRQGETRVRIDGYGWVRWRNAKIDPSNGAQKYYIRLNAANGGRVTGGFGIDVPGRLSGIITELRVDGATVKQNFQGPPRAVAVGLSEFGGRKYRAEFAVVGDYSRPPQGANKRGVYVPGSIHVKLFGPLPKSGGKASAPLQEAVSVERTQVRFEIRWSASSDASGGRRTGGAVRPSVR